MQSTSSQFKQYAIGATRPLSWQFKASFDKIFSTNVGFFTLDVSLLNDTDLLAPSDNNVVQEWDKYTYTDYSDRIMEIGWQREEEVPFSVNLAMADITLNNYDDLFTRGVSSPIDEFLLPRRPIRIFSGFGNENLPQFVGLTEKVPKVDHSARTAILHAVDFLSFLFEKPLDETILYEDIRTDEALDVLFQSVGLTPSQYELDEGFNTIQFLYFPKGTTLGAGVRQLMEAEMGRLYMDELGIIRFKNRYRVLDTPVYTFDESSIVDYSILDEDSIINVVEVNSEIREVQAVQPVFTLAQSIRLENGSNEVFFNFNDPVTSLEPITVYTANSSEDGSGSNVTGSVSITNTELFATAVKVTFDNASASTAYITAIDIEGTPAIVVDTIALRVQDDASVEEFEEHVLTIDNNFIQDNDTANSLALSLIAYYKDYGNTINLDVKSTPALQLGDNIQATIDDVEQTYTIMKIINTIANGMFKQTLKGRVFITFSFFTLDESTLNSTDVLSP